MSNEQQNLEKAKGNDVIAEPEASPSRSCPVRHNFPDKLHYVLNEMAKDGLEHIMSWQPHGYCFVVHDQKRLEQHILPTWFRQSRFSSFQRQLNIYGFSRIPRGKPTVVHLRNCSKLMFLTRTIRNPLFTNDRPGQRWLLPSRSR